ncbi:immunoglobulin-like domain-containing protein [Listeria cornellensis]|uniref:Uncharacterized protein n=1 Tax=Listeria cornellensis FSL F6-0969 TaxID=1265820 RepID=W7BZE7_9LIST|nr:immunoglobulin-like domain-containing protein [Listeria cornellensis]EUJ32554.1 hypothetical protein PCORN_01180 [Listeria cornellensis FSL F6-0969]
MNKNIKKVATVILATNVLASTVLTTLPLGTHAAESQVSTKTPAEQVNDAKSALDALFVDGNTAKGIHINISQADLDNTATLIDAIENETDKVALQVNLKKATDAYTAIHAFQRLNITDNYVVQFDVSIPAGYKFSYTLEKNGKYAGHLISNGAAYYLSKTATGAQQGGWKDDQIASIYVVVDNVKYTLASATVSIAFQKAEKAVQSLFIDNDTSKAIQPTLTLAAINAAQELVSALSNVTQKEALQANIDKAIEAFNTIAPTTIEALTSNSTKAIGKGEPNASVSIKNGDTVIGTGTVNADGTFEIDIEKQAPNATITATVTKVSNGKTASASTNVTEAIDYSLTSNSFKIGDTILTGTAGKNVFKVRLWVNGVVAVQGNLHPDGTYEFPSAANFIKKVGDKIEVVAVDSKYVEVNRQAVIVSGAPILDNALTVNAYTYGEKQMAGQVGKDVFKVRLWVNDKVVTQADMNGDGTYTFGNARQFINSPLDKIELVAVDSKYKEINRIAVSAPKPDLDETSFTAETYEIGQNTLSGSFGKNTSKVRLWINGTVAKQADLDIANNSYTLKGIKGLIKNDTDKVEVVFVDEEYKEIKRINVTVK